MAYGLGHLSSTTGSKCIKCGKVTGNYLDVCEYTKNGEMTLGTSIKIPICDEHRSILFNQKELLIAHAKLINTLCRGLKLD